MKAQLCAPSPALFKVAPLHRSFASAPELRRMAIDRYEGPTPAVSVKPRLADERRTVGREPPAPPASPATPLLATPEPTLAAAAPATPATPAAMRPQTFAQQIEAFSRMLRDPEYARGLGAMVVNQGGDGLVNGGFFVLLNVLGVIMPPLSVAGMMVFNLVDVLIGIGGQVYAASLRDRAEGMAETQSCPKARNEEKLLHAGRLFQSGLLDAAAASVLLGGAVATSLGLLGPWGLFGVLTLTKALQSFNMSYESGAWNSLVFFMGNGETQCIRRSIRSMSSTLEIAASALVTLTCSTATYFATMALTLWSMPAAMMLSMGAIALGGVLCTVPKLTLGKWLAARSA